MKIQFKHWLKGSLLSLAALGVIGGLAANPGANASHRYAWRYYHRYVNLNYYYHKGYYSNVGRNRRAHWHHYRYGYYANDWRWHYYSSGHYTESGRWIKNNRPRRARRVKRTRKIQRVRRKRPTTRSSRQQTKRTRRSTAELVRRIERQRRSTTRRSVPQPTNQTPAVNFGGNSVTNPTSKASNQQPSQPVQQPAKPAQQTSQPAPVSVDDQVRDETFKDINRDRAANGVGQLAESPQLMRLANLRAQQLRTRFSHYDNNGQPYAVEDDAQVGIPNQSDWAENIAEEPLADNVETSYSTYNNRNGIDIADHADDGMLNHDADSNWGHRRNILNGNSTEVGIGVAHTGEKYYIAEDFN